MSLDFHAPIPPNRGIFCNRTLNLRSIKAIGYDMDYTLIHYRVEEWERRAYAHIRDKLLARGWPVESFEFQPDRFVRGLVIDQERGNIVKANRFGYVKRATHGMTPLSWEAQRTEYSRTVIDLGSPRFTFLNTLFSMSEACIFSQAVDLLDEGRLPEVLGYGELYRTIRASLDEAHMEGVLKEEIVTHPERFIELDPDLPLTLLDQQYAGKKLLLITNSEWAYTNAMMAYAFDRYLPDGTWRDLFDIIIVQARKPHFFSTDSPLFEIVNEDGLLRPAPAGMRSNGMYVGGHASLVEQYLGVAGDEILYVGDHIFSDVNVSKSVLRWRTALVLRELENEIAATAAFEPTQEELTALMAEKEHLELARSRIRLALQRRRKRYGPAPEESTSALEKHLERDRRQIAELDERIGKLAVAAGALSNQHWGPLMRAGNDKSHMARQVERYADIYLSRVSNFLAHTPYIYLRAPRGSLPHDQEDRARYGVALDESPL